MPYTAFPRGVTLYDPAKAYGCYVLFDGRDHKSYLIDMNGNEVKTWPFENSAGKFLSRAEP